MRKEAVYSLVCRENDDRVVRGRIWRSCEVKKKVQKRPRAAWLTGNARRHSCDRRRCAKKSLGGVFGLDEKQECKN